MARSNAGGGLGSRQVVRPEVRTGSGAKGVRPAYTAQIGSMKGSHLTDGRDIPETALFKKDAMAKPAGNTVKYGNELALNSKSAPGQGREIHRTGSQQQWGTSAPSEGRPAGTADRGPRAILGPKGS